MFMNIHEALHDLEFRTAMEEAVDRLRADSVGYLESEIARGQSLESSTRQGNYRQEDFRPNI